MKTIFTCVFIFQSPLFFIALWLTSDLDTAWNKFEEIVDLILK